MDIDPEYEYNAPQFVDFDLIRKGQDVSFGEGNPDDYFNFDHENGIPVDLPADVSSPVKAESTNEKGHNPAPVVHSEYDQGSVNPSSTSVTTEQTIVAESSVDTNPPKPQIKEVASNICTSLEEWNKKKEGAKKTSGTTDEPKPRLKRSNSVLSAKAKPNVSSTTKQHTRSRTRSVELKMKSLSGQRSGHSGRRSTSRNTSVNSSMSSDNSLNMSKNRSMDKAKDNVPPQKLKLTLPMTPKFMSRKMKSNGTAKSTEELEMERIQVLKQELKKRKHLAEESLKKSQKTGAYAPVKSACLATKPMEFHFASDSRIKGEKQENNRVTKKEFASSLRAHPTSPGRHKIGGITKPEPFKFASECTRKRKHEEADSHPDKYESMAETLAKFSTKTPERFRTKPQNKKPTPTRKRFCSGDKPRLTHPKTPSLQTRTRSRSTHIVSQTEMEEHEIEEMKTCQFKAHPVNSKILKPDGVIGLKKVVSKQPTQIEAFDLEMGHRAMTKSSANQSTDETKHEFHARPVPKSILERPMGVPEAKSLPITVPQSPAFALKNRLRSQVKSLQLEPEEEEHIIRAKPVPHLGIPFQPKVQQQKITLPKPFSFETRDRDTKTKREARIKKMLEDEKKAREFHANPIPDLSPTLPPKQEVHVTRPEPFELEAEIRGAIKAEEWARKVEDELKQQRDVAKFKARPSKVTKAEPFLPKRDSRPLTEVNEVELNSERRARERMEYEKWKKEQELECEASQFAEQKRREQHDEEERRRIRAHAVPRAQPVRHYRPVVIHPSDKPLTEAETPRFSQRLKKKVRC